MATPNYKPPQRQVSEFQLVDSQFAFTGQWLPSMDATRIGPENFKTLRNTRYNQRAGGGIEGILGYTKVNTSDLSTYTKIWNGFQLRVPYTQTSYVLVHAVNPNTGQGRVYENRTAINSQGNFEATHLHADSAVNLLGRFSDAPGGSVAYANTEEVMIYSGDEMRCSGFFLVDNTDHDLPEDYTLAVNNTLTTAANIVTINQADKGIFLIFSTRKLSAVKFAVSSANVSASTLSAEYFNGSWTAVSNPSDGTSSGGVALAQSGTFSFDSTVSDAEPFHFEGLFMYAYRFTLSAGSANVSTVTLKAPWQNMLDLWDGVYRQPIQWQFFNNSDSAYEDYTLHVNQSSSIDTPIGGELDGMTTSDHIIIMFEERMSAIQITMLANKINKAASVATVKYWNGDAFAAVSNQSDGTLNAAGTKSFSQSGLISWTPPAESAEVKRTLFGTTGYAYQITVSGTLTGTHGDTTYDVIVDLTTGITAQQTIKPFTFSGLFQGRLMLGNFKAGREQNRMDYTSRDTVEVWNGYDSSMDGVQSLYFGGMDGLTGGLSLYNRFGSAIYSIYMVTKNSETYVLDGESPEDFKIYPVSSKIGCPAPLTMDTAELGFEMADGIQRNVAIWLSYSGPVMFDGAVLRPIEGLEDFFDPNSDLHVNFDQIDKSRGWVDYTRREYNLIVPMSSETTPNKWFVYDLFLKRWFEKFTQTAAMIQCGFPVFSDLGVQYIYSGSLVGRLYHIEKGTTWDSVAINQVIQVGDFWPSGNIWHKTRVRWIMLVAKKNVEEAEAYIYHFPDTDDQGTDTVNFRDTDDVVFAEVDTDGDGFVDTSWAATSTLSVDLSLSGPVERVAKQVKPLNKLAWTHGFSFVMSTSATTKGFQPLVWGIRWEYERHERGN